MVQMVTRLYEVLQITLNRSPVATHHSEAQNLCRFNLSSVTLRDLYFGLCLPAIDS